MEIIVGVILLLTTALNLALPYIIGMVISMFVQRTYIYRLIWILPILTALYIVSRLGFGEPIDGVGFANVAIASALTALYNGRVSEKEKKKKLVKQIVRTIQPTIKLAISENKKISEDTLSSDLYYGYIVGFVAQIQRDAGFEDGGLDIEPVFGVMKKLSNRRVAETHKIAVHAFFYGNHHLIGRSIKAFEDGCKVGEYDAKNKQLDNLRNIISGRKLHYKMDSEQG